MSSLLLVVVLASDVLRTLVSLFAAHECASLPSLFAPGGALTIPLPGAGPQVLNAANIEAVCEDNPGWAGHFVDGMPGAGDYTDSRQVMQRHGSATFFGVVGRFMPARPTQVCNHAYAFTLVGSVSAATGKIFNATQYFDGAAFESSLAARCSSGVAPAPPGPSPPSAAVAAVLGLWTAFSNAQCDDIPSFCSTSTNFSYTDPWNNTGPGLTVEGIVGFCKAASPVARQSFVFHHIVEDGGGFVTLTVSAGLTSTNEVSHQPCTVTYTEHFVFATEAVSPGKAVVANIRGSFNPWSYKTACERCNILKNCPF